MKLFNTLVLKAQKHKQALTGAGIILASMLAIPRLIRHRLRRKPPEPPSAKGLFATEVPEQTDGEVMPGRVNTQDTSLSPSSRRRFPKAILKSRRRQRMLVAAVILGLMLAGAAFYLSRPSKTTYYIAYVGRYQRTGFDELHTLALSKYIEELNAGLHGVRLELKILKTEKPFDWNDSRKAYQEIAANKEFVLVIDNTWGSGLKSVADIIRNQGIPVIAINGDKQGEDYGQKVVFIGYDDEVPTKVNNFSKQILENKEVIFIAEADFASTVQFRKYFSGSLTPTTSLYVKGSSTTTDPTEAPRLLDAINKALNNLAPFPRKERPTVIINAHAQWGGIIIDHINNSFKGIDILGGPYIINWEKRNKLEMLNDNSLIVFTYPSDTVTNKLHKDLKGIETAYNNLKLIEVKPANQNGNANSGSNNSEIKYAALAERLNVQLYVKRCLDAVSIVGGFFHEEPTRRAVLSKADFIRYFRDRLAGKDIVRRDGRQAYDDLYTFDKDLLMSDERTFEQHFRGEVFSHRQQLNSKEEVISNINFGLDNIKISNIDIKNRSFRADFLYWLRSDKDLKDAHKYILFGNQKTGNREELNFTENEKGEKVYQLLKMSGDFSMDFNLKRYPLDAQELRIELEIIFPAEALRISFDHESFKRSKNEPQVVNADEWNIRDSYVTVDNYIATSLGGGASLESKQLQKFKILNVRMPAYKHWTGSVVTIILPLVMIGLVAVALLYVKDSSFSNIGEVCIGVFLSIITYSIAFAQITPRSNVLTVADKLFYGTFLIVFLVFLKVILFNSRMIGDSVRDWTSAKAIHIGTVVLVLYLLMLTGIIFPGML